MESGKLEFSPHHRLLSPPSLSLPSTNFFCCLVCVHTAWLYCSSMSHSLLPSVPTSAAPVCSGGGADGRSPPSTDALIFNPSSADNIWIWVWPTLPVGFLVSDGDGLCPTSVVPALCGALALPSDCRISGGMFVVWDLLAAGADADRSKF